VCVCVCVYIYIYIYIYIHLDLPQFTCYTTLRYADVVKSNKVYFSHSVSLT
jgi:hypothetical protein